MLVESREVVGALEHDTPAEGLAAAFSSSIVTDSRCYIRLWETSHYYTTFSREETIRVLGMEHGVVRFGAEHINAIRQLTLDANLTCLGCISGTKLVVQEILREGCVRIALHVAGDIRTREQETTAVLQVVCQCVLQLSWHTVEGCVVTHNVDLLLAEDYIYEIVICNAIQCRYAGADIGVAHLGECLTMESWVVEGVTYGRVVHVVAVAHTPTAIVIGLPFVAAVKVIYLTDIVHILAIGHGMARRTDTTVDAVAPPLRTAHAGKTVDDEHVAFLLRRDIGR